MSREAIYAALFARVSTLPGLVTASRRLKHWHDTPPALQPALFMVQKRERPEQQSGLPTKWAFTVELYLYVHGGADPNAVPAQALNALLDALEEVLAPDPASGVQTLGGLVTHVWIDPAGIETDEGVLGDQAIAIVPVQIVA